MVLGLGDGAGGGDAYMGTHIYIITNAIHASATKI